MKDLTSYIKENDSDVVELDILKKILITLSKEIPNSKYEDDKKYLDEYNNIENNIDALKLLNKRLSYLVPRTRIIKYDIYEEMKFADANYKEDKIEVDLTSYGNWNDEFDSSGARYQYKKAYINDYLKVNLEANDVSESEIWLGSINEGNTYNYTELDGYLPCHINNKGKTQYAYLKFYEDSIILCCNDWSFLGNTRKEYELYFNGVVDYRSYEDYTETT